ncbi:hypothetical protein [Sinorhizobium medicae]
MRGFHRTAIGRSDRPFVSVALNSKKGIGIDHAGHLLIVNLHIRLPHRPTGSPLQQQAREVSKGTPTLSPMPRRKYGLNEAIHDIQSVQRRRQGRRTQWRDASEQVQDRKNFPLPFSPNTATFVSVRAFSIPETGLSL